MRWLLILLVACVVLTALKFAVIALALVLLIAVLLGAFVHPAETLGLLAFFLFARAFTTHTVATLAFLGVVGLCLSISGRSARREDASEPNQTDDPGIH